MEIIITILCVLVIYLLYTIKRVSKCFDILFFSVGNINKLLIKKGLIEKSEIDIILNETIGDMSKEEGDKIIKNAKDIGIKIPKYMDEEELKQYVEMQKAKRTTKDYFDL